MQSKERLLLILARLNQIPYRKHAEVNVLVIKFSSLVVGSFGLILKKESKEKYTKKQCNDILRILRMPSFMSL